MLAFKILLASVTVINSVLIIYGPKTPESLVTRFQEFTSLNLLEIPNVSYLQSQLVPKLIFDISFDPFNFPLLDSISDYFQTPYITLTKSIASSTSKLRIFAFPSLKAESKAIAKLIRFLEWDSFVILGLNSQDNFEFSDLIKSEFANFQVKSIFYDSQINEAQIDLIIRKLIKSKSLKNFLILDEGSSLDLCLQVIKQRKINVLGSYFIFRTQGFFSIDLEGAVSIGYDKLMNSTSLIDFYINALNYIITELSIPGLLEPHKLCQDQVCLSKFFIYNQKNKVKQKVGQITDQVQITQPILFPGGNPSPRLNITKTKLSILIANGTSEPNNQPGFNETSKMYFGSLFASEEVNSKLKHFEYELIPTNCGNQVLDIAWYIKCLSSFASNSHLAYLTGFWVQSAMGNLLSIRTRQVFIPQVSPYGLSEVMNNKSAFPEFLKLSPHYYKYMKNGDLTQRIFKWPDYMFLYANDMNIKPAAQIIIELYRGSGLKLITPVQYQMIPLNYTREDFESNRNVFEYIRDSKCRVLCLLTGYDPGMALEALYDVGLRRGDLIIMGNFNLYFALLKDTDEKFLAKRREILDGAIFTSMIEYEGEIGEKIEKEFLGRFDDVTMMCSTYDAFYTISNAIEYLIEKGVDFEDPHLLMSTLRNQKFAGCSGNIKFNSFDNSKSCSSMNILQLQINFTSSVFKLNRIFTFNRLSTPIFKVLSPPKWYTSDGSVPTNYREDSKCVYHQNKQQSKYGKVQMHIVSCFVLFLSLVAAIKSNSKFKTSLTSLPRGIVPNFNHFIYLSYFLMQFFQIIALQPTLNIVPTQLRSLLYLSGFDFISAFDLKFDDYWNSINFLLIAALGFVVLTVLFAVFRIRLRRKNWISGCLHGFAPNFLPIVGHFGFVPMSVMLLGVFRCEEGISDEMFESVFFRDCSTFCYQGRHRFFVIGSGLSLFVYVPLSVYYRPYWEVAQENLIFKTKPLYISILSMFQIVIVLVKHNVEVYSEISSGVIISGLLILFIILTLIIKPYNYKRSFVFQVFTLLSSFLFITINTISLRIGHNLILMSIFALGFTIFVLFECLLLSKYRSIFINENTDIIPELFKYQFGGLLSGVKAMSKYIENSWASPTFKSTTNNN